MAWIELVSVLALLQYMWFGFQVGGARGKYGIKAPAVAGHEAFERIYRVPVVSHCFSEESALSRLGTQI